MVGAGAAPLSRPCTPMLAPTTRAEEIPNCDPAGRLERHFGRHHHRLGTTFAFGVNSTEREYPVGQPYEWRRDQSTSDHRRRSQLCSLALRANSETVANAIAVIFGLAITLSGIVGFIVFIAPNFATQTLISLFLKGGKYYRPSRSESPRTRPSSW
jgi:hypothetical protein